jgi:hypothetical protein
MINIHMFGVCAESTSQVACPKTDYTAFMCLDNVAEKVCCAFSWLSMEYETQLRMMCHFESVQVHEVTDSC